MQENKVVNITREEATNTDVEQKTEGYFSDLSKVRLQPDYATGLGVKKLLTNVPVRKPNRQWWVRVHPSEEYRIPAGLIEVEGEDTYYVDPSMHIELAGDLVFKNLYLTVNRQGVPFLWPIRMPSEDGRLDDWNRVAQEGAELAMKEWVRVSSNRSAGTYDIWQTDEPLPEPNWPTESFSKLLEIGFKNRIISDPGHAVVRELQGRA